MSYEDNESNNVDNESNNVLHSQILFSNFFLVETEDEDSEQLEDPSLLDNLEESHVIDLFDTMCELLNEVMSLNIVELYHYLESLTLTYLSLLAGKQ